LQHFGHDKGLKMNRFIMLAAGLCVLALPAFAQEKPVSEELVLDQAIAWALENSPVLGAQASYAEAAIANRSQAGAFANPEVEIEAENIYGDADGTSEAEMTYGISQLVELPGKRGNRIRMADAESVKAHYAHDAAQLDLIRDVTIAYAEVVAAQQELSILEEERSLAAEVRDSVAAKVEAGKEPPIQQNKAQIELSSSEIALDRAHRRMAIAKKQSLVSPDGWQCDEFCCAAY
jgi:cobalt-zinc-cadmium efflux system outer membrane protein